MLFWEHGEKKRKKNEKDFSRVNADRVVFVVKVRPNPGGVMQDAVGQR
jgi:hypothetical protein